MNQPEHGQAPEAPLPCRGFVTELVVRCGRGDEAALERLLDLLYAPVLADAARRGRPRPEDEVVSEAFARLWRAAPGFVPGAQCAVEWAMGLLTAPVDSAPHVLVAS